MAARIERISNDEGATPGESALRSLVQTYGLLQRLMQPHFAAFGITTAQWGALRALERAERSGETSLRITELSNRLLVQPPSMTGVVDKLEREGLINRAASAADGRVRELSLTGRGRKLLIDFRKAHPDIYEDVLAGLSKTEERQLRGLLTKLSRHIETLL